MVKDLRRRGGGNLEGCVILPEQRSKLPNLLLLGGRGGEEKPKPIANGKSGAEGCGEASAHSGLSVAGLGFPNPSLGGAGADGGELVLLRHAAVWVVDTGMGGSCCCLAPDGRF